jgi:UDP-2,3-diacylglucosamine hydrolase
LVRFQALLARWTDRGVPVTYLFGNHDPWHRDYFPEELGVALVPGPLEAEHHGRRLHLAHGDAEASTHPAYAWVRPLLRHPLAIRLYRSLLPADWALGLARRVSRALHEPAPDPAVVQALESHARTRVREEADLVVRGHSHEPALHRWPEGTYLNIGNWYESRTFARLDGTTVSLVRWNGTRGHAIESAEV